MKPEERHAQLELCIPYVFGRLNPGNRKQFDAHLATGCEQCKRELSELYEATALLPLLLRQEPPPTGVRQRLLTRVSSKKPEQPRVERPAPQREKVEAPKVEAPTVQPERPWYLYASIVMGILIIVALSIFVNELVRTTALLEKRVTDLQGELQQKQEVLSVLQAQRLEVFPLASLEASSNAYGKIFWNPANRRAVLQVVNLSAEPNDKQYQLWMLKGKSYISVGVFDVENENNDLSKMMTLPVAEKQEIEGFEVTLEARGGGTQPTGTVHLRGSTR